MPFTEQIEPSDEITSLQDRSPISTILHQPMKLKFRKHAVSEKDRLKNVGHIPTKCKSRRCAYCYTRVKHLTERDECAITVMSDHDSKK
ncbi:hypothetical protein TNIN_77371 [Trichonephila inaurata madagascariensis]|uniref:Uncharacterized protein n=1 Tax=Trichonephila inaurata madagascariensis TaxID=2747483 RepID=A0A8X7BWY7_9ARAC|nr:hypothetical protein TNIN_77371 [Trichonephila inaurata madagascariensis]